MLSRKIRSEDGSRKNFQSNLTIHRIFSPFALLLVASRPLCIFKATILNNLLIGEILLKYFYSKSMYFAHDVFIFLLLPHK